MTPAPVERFLIAWTGMLARHRLALIIILALLAFAGSLASRSIQWEGDLLAFFSADSAEVRAVREASSRPGIATQLRFDLSSPSASEDDLKSAAAKLAMSLKQSNQFREVWSGVSPTDLASRYAAFLDHAPLLLTDAELAEVKSRAAEPWLTQRFAAVKSHLADPDGEIELRRLASDPLNLTEFITRKLESLSPATVANMRLSDGYLLTRSADGALHLMLVAEPRSAPSDQHAAEQTMAAVNNAIDKVSAGHHLHIAAIGAHRAYVENAQQARRDVTLVGAVGSLAVGLLLWLAYRRLRIALLCLLPATVGIGLTLGLAGLLHLQLPLLILAFVGLLCGSTTDYCIQIAQEYRRLAAEPHDPVTLPAAAASRLAGPIFMSCLTSALSYAALALSASPGLRALGLFVAAATALIWLVTFLILPAFLGPWILSHSPAPRPVSRFIRWGGTVLFLVATLLLAKPAFTAAFNRDPRALDGTSAQFRADEAAFYQTWGDLRNRAVLLIRSPNPDSALALLESVTADLAQLQADGQLQHFSSPSALLPCQATLAERTAAWRDVWSFQRRTQLEKLLPTLAKTQGFNPDAFDRYPAHLPRIPTPTPETLLADSPVGLFPGLLSQGPASTALAILVEMNDFEASPHLAASWATELRLRHATPDNASLTILSGNLLLLDASDRAQAEGQRLIPLCILAILLPLWLFFRRLRTAWLVLTPLFVALLWTFATARFLGGLNLLGLIPVLFTLGVAIDYGIYAATSGSGGGTPSPSRDRATFLCFLSTLLGTLPLLLAQHPAIRWLGATLSAGTLAGYLAAAFLVAPLARRALTRQPSKLSRFLLTPLIGAALLLLTLALAAPNLADWYFAKEQPSRMATFAPNECIPVGKPSDRTFASRASWMRWRPSPSDPASGLWELALVGDPFQRGHAATALAGPIESRIEHEMLAQLDLHLPAALPRFLIVRGMTTNLLDLSSYVPDPLQEEIFSAASTYRDPFSYLAPAYPRILAYHALHDVSQMLIDNPLVVPNDFACTGVLALPTYASGNGGGHLLLARNFDFEGGQTFSIQKSLTFVIPTEPDSVPFAHVAWPGLSGAVTGINQERLALFINAAATKDFRRIGTPTILLARQVLQTCRTLDEAEALIRQTPVFVSDILVLADGKTGKARVIEKSPAATASYEVSASAVVTNHLLTDRFKNDPVNQRRIREGTTAQRYARARQLLDRLEGRVTPSDLVSLLRDKRGLNDVDLGLGNRNAIDGLIACHGAVIDATDGILYVSTSPHVEGEFLAIDVLSTLNRLSDAARKPGGTIGDASTLSSITQLPALQPILRDSIVVPHPDGRDSYTDYLSFRTLLEDATTALRRSDDVAALRACQSALELNPHSDEPHTLMAHAYLQQHNIPAAKAAAQRALLCHPAYEKVRAALQRIVDAP